MKTWRAALQLMRPANMVTAVADVLAGIAIIGVFSTQITLHIPLFKILLLCIATACLYAGGIIFNDVFDIEDDKKNRPERIIPSGKLSLKKAKQLGIFLFSLGIITAFLTSNLSGLIAIKITLFALLYDAYCKHNKILGPLTMGICRGLNLTLGMSVLGLITLNYYFIAIIPIIFVAAITLTAQKEAHGKNKLAIAMAILLDTSILFGFYMISNFFEHFSLKRALLFLCLWYGVNVISKFKALINNNPKTIQQAVKTAVLSLIPLNASYAAGFSSLYLGIFILCLLPLSIYLSKKFPVT